MRMPPPRNPDEIVKVLVKQVKLPGTLGGDNSWPCEPDGVAAFVELGPGRVLSGLVRRIDPDVEVLNVEDPASWSKFVAWAEGNDVI